MSVHKQTPTLAINGDSGWLSMKYKHYLNIFKCYNHLLMVSSDQLTRQAVESDLHHITNNNWCSLVERNLQILNKEENLQNHETIEINTARKALECINNEEFQQKILDKPKLRLYKLFKRNIETEKYLTANLSRYERSLIGKLRTGTLPLAIYTGRFRKILLEDRLCILCNSNLIGDEKHFICVCKFYDDLRQKLCRELNIDSNECLGELFVKIMTTNKIYCLASYIGSHGIKEGYLCTIYNKLTNYVSKSCDRIIKIPYLLKTDMYIFSIGLLLYCINKI